MLQKELRREKLDEKTMLKSSIKKNRICINYAGTYFIMLFSYKLGSSKVHGNNTIWVLANILFLFELY